MVYFLHAHDHDAMRAVILQEIAPTPEEIQAAEAHIRVRNQPAPKHDIDGKSALKPSPEGTMLPEEEFVLELTQSVPLLHLRLVRACVCVRVRVFVCVCVCARACVFTYARACTYTGMYMWRRRFFWRMWCCTDVSI